MRIAIASLGKDLDSLVSPSFGQSPYIIIVDIENGEVKNFEVIENRFLGFGRGKGIALANELISKNVDAVVAGNFGGNAYDILVSSGIKLFAAPALKVRDAAIKASKGELPPATRMGRWGRYR